MNCSLFFNTRKRIRLHDGLIASVRETVADEGSLEIIVRADDDKETLDYLEGLDIENLNVVCGERPNTLNATINEMAISAKGNFLFVVNDDVLFQTRYWDMKLADNFDKDEILYIGTTDNGIDKTRNQNYSSFPILTRVAYDSLGTSCRRSLLLMVRMSTCGEYSMNSI